MKIAIFCSGNGTNFQAIVDSAKKGFVAAEVALMVCDNPKAYAIIRAKDAGVKTLIVELKNFQNREAFEDEIIRSLEREDIGLIVLAGYMKMLTPKFVRRYRDRILNIHPALLPSFAGASGIEDALKYGVRVTGPTVHFVNEDMDTGPIILQKAIEITEGDTEETLAERIHKLEHELYPKAIRLFVEGRLKIEGRKVRIKGGNDTRHRP